MLRSASGFADRVTFHGLSLNVDPDLDHFTGIVPCGDFCLRRDQPCRSRPAGDDGGCGYPTARSLRIGLRQNGGRTLVHIDRHAFLWLMASFPKACTMSQEQSPHNPLQGMVIMAGAMVVLPAMDAIAKYMATFEAMSPGQVTFYRFFFQVACTLPILLRRLPLEGAFGKATMDEPAAGRLAWRSQPALLRRGQIHAARGCLRDLFRGTIHADGSFGALPRRQGRLAAVGGDRRRLRRCDDRHPTELRNLRHEGAAASALCLPFLALSLPQPGNR